MENGESGSEKEPISSDEMMFIVLRHFTIAANSMEDISPPLYTALSVNSAFAVEVGLKLLLVLDGKKQPTHHDLSAMFYRLKIETQSVLEEKWDRYQTAKGVKFANGKITPSTLKEALQRSQGAFVQWRYLWEGDKIVEYFLPQLLRAITEVVLDRKPEWSNIYPKPEMRFVSQRDLDQVSFKGFQAGFNAGLREKS